MPIRREAVVIGPGVAGMLRVSLGRPPGDHVVNAEAARLPAPLRMPNAEFVAEIEGAEVIGVAASGRAWLEVQNQIRTVLNAHWDPIGVADQVHDEYDSYIDGLYWMLRDGRPEEAIAEHLREIETKMMEFPGQPLVRLRRVAARLKGLQLPIIENSTA